MKRSLCIALLLTVGITAGAGATSFVNVRDEALVDGASLAVVGRVVAIDRAAGIADGRTRTEIRVAVEDVLKGVAPGREIVVEAPGGLAAGGMALKIYGAPRVRTDERLLLLLTPRGTSFAVEHLMLGLFHETRVAGHTLAVRNFEGASEVRLAAEGIEVVAPRESLRDFGRFAEWVRARGIGAEGDAYAVAEEPGLRLAVDSFTLFEDEDDFFNLRWFVFDTGTSGNVSWRALNVGQSGISGGGYSEFQTALQAWNNESQTPVDYRYAGTTSSTNGLDNYDTTNSVVFNDPTNAIEPFSCVTGGTLAFGGPWYQSSTRNFKGVPHHEIANADIVINNGISCFFSSSPNASKAAQELFGHELGHTLGIDHSCGDPGGPSCNNSAFDQALMRAFVHDDARGASLAADDRAAVQALYLQGSAPAAPTNLTATATSTTVIQLNWTDNATNETEFRVEMSVLGGGFVDIGAASANATVIGITALAPATGYKFRVRARNASGDSAYSNEATAATNALPGACVPDGVTKCLLSNRFRVRALWKPSGGVQSAANVAPAGSDSSGLFYFNNANNWELLIKAINGCTLTNAYWVFYAATTNVELTITVTDTQNAKTKVYFNPQGTPAPPVQDTGAFATCP